MSLGDNEAGARILINRLLESAGWRFEDSAEGKANIKLESRIKYSDLGDDFENAHAAKSAKKVVGIPGVITPIYAHPTKNRPNALHNQIFITIYF